MKASTLSPVLQTRNRTGVRVSREGKFKVTRPPPARVRPPGAWLPFHLSEHFLENSAKLTEESGASSCAPSRQVCHEEGVRRHLAPRLVGVALPHDAAAAAEAACPPGGRAVERWRAGCFRPNAAPSPATLAGLPPAPALALPDRKAPGFHAASHVPSCRLAPRVQRLRRRAQPSSAPPQPGPSGPHPETSSRARPQQQRRAASRDGRRPADRAGPGAGSLPEVRDFPQSSAQRPTS